MRLSIIIPLYNIEDYIADCLEKITELSDESIEVIVVNDGSTDSSILKVENFKDRIKNLVIINQENAGVCVARNTGISIAKGEYIYLCDGDDFICPNQFQELLKHTIDNDLDMGAANGIYLHENECTKKILSSKKIERMGKTSGPNYFRTAVLSMEYSSTVWLFIIRRSIILDNQITFTPSTMHEDEEFLSLCFVHVKNIQFWDLDIYRYRQRAGSLTKPKTHRYLSNESIPSYMRIISRFEQLKNEAKQEDVKEVYQISIMRSYLAICRRLKYRAKKQFDSEFSNFDDLITAPFDELPFKYRFPIWKMRARIWLIHLFNRIKRAAAAITSLAF